MTVCWLYNLTEKLKQVSIKASEYGSDCIAQAAENCDLELTREQLECLAEAAENGHEHYSQAFYSPPNSDQITDIERQYRQKLKQQQQEHERSIDTLNENAAWQKRQLQQRIYRLEDLLENSNRNE